MIAQTSIIDLDLPLLCKLSTTMRLGKIQNILFFVRNTCNSKGTKLSKDRNQFMGSKI